MPCTQKCVCRIKQACSKNINFVQTLLLYLVINIGYLLFFVGSNCSVLISIGINLMCIIIFYVYLTKMRMK